MCLTLIRRSQFFYAIFLQLPFICNILICCGIIKCFHFENYVMFDCNFCLLMWFLWGVYVIYGFICQVLFWTLEEIKAIYCYYYLFQWNILKSHFVIKVRIFELKLVTATRFTKTKLNMLFVDAIICLNLWVLLVVKWVFVLSLSLSHIYVCVCVCYAVPILLSQIVHDAFSRNIDMFLICFKSFLE